MHSSLLHSSQLEMASNESLFSFEVAVQWLCINVNTVTCRLPALAVRFLDFPTLMIPHLEREERDRIKKAVLFEAHGKVPNILEDLLDSRGKFQFNKGKSCMFKFDVDALYSNLQNVPLYVTVTDLWGDAPKLIGVCTVPLTDVISDIKRDVHAKGISCPTMHSRRSTFPIFNLMGSEVGNLDLGYRLLSLGQSIMPHIPSASVLSMEPRKSKGGQGIIDRCEAPNEGECLNTAQHDDDVHETFHKNDDDNIETVMQTGMENMGSQQYLTKSSAVGFANQQTQTYVARGSKSETEANDFIARPSVKSTRTSDLCDSEQHVIASNTHCPPPLFFNSTYDSHETVKPQRVITQQLSPDASWSESSESYHRKNMELHYKWGEGSPGLIRKVVKEVETSKSSKFGERHLSAERKQWDHETSDASVNVEKTLPILSALLKELSVLTGVKSSNLHRTARALTEEKENIKPANDIEQKAPGRTLTQSTDEVLDVPHFQQPRHKSCRHDRCTEPPKTVPSAKGWLRQEPKLVKKQTKLQFKMTYSQKLRLKKNNPELLKMMEGEEQNHTINYNRGKRVSEKAQKSGQRKNKSKQKRSNSKVVGAGKSSSSHSFYQYHPDVPTEVAIPRHRVTVAKFTEELSPPSRPPIPTPRKSLSIDNSFRRIESTDLDEETIPFAGTEDGAYRQENSSGIINNDLSASEKSATRSIDVYIPNPSLVKSDSESGEEQSYDNESEHLHQSEVSRTSALNRPNIGIPGFPADSLESAANRSSYSQDFESVRGSSSGRSSSHSIDGSNSSQSSYHSPKDEDQSASMSEHGDNSKEEEVLADATDLVKSAESREDESNFTKECNELGAVPVKPVLSRLTIPQPPLSSVSPVPQYRNPVGTKILLTKPVSVNAEEYNDSGEVNLPSDLSASFDDKKQSRSKTGSLGLSQDVPYGHRQSNWQSGQLDAIKSEAESIESIGQYSHDFDSDE